MPTRLLVGLLLALGGLACGCTGERLDLLSSSRQDIVGGSVSGAEDDAVVWISAQQDVATQRCTATLVAPNLIVTALHCVANYVELDFTCDSSGNLTLGPGGQMGTVVDPASKVTVQIGTKLKPTVVATAALGKQIFAGQTNTICLNDIAFVVLDREIAMPIRPIRLYTGVLSGERMRVVGYGLDENKDVWTRHYRTDAIVDKVGTSSLKPVGDNVPPRSFTSIGNGLCIGDSGGPAVSEAGAVAGVYSKVIGVCTASTAVDTFTQLAPFANDLVLPAFQAAGYEPWLEGNTEPGLYGIAGAGTGGASSAGGGSPTGSLPTGGSPNATGGTTSAPATSGGAPLGSGGDTSAVVYDQGPAPGGTCACRTVGTRFSRGFGVAMVALFSLGLRRRIRA